MYEYSQSQKLAIYELARLYYELGYSVPAERIFTGLVAIDPEFDPARLGLGVLHLERGSYEAALACLREVTHVPQAVFFSRIAIAVAFILTGDKSRAKSLLLQIERESSAELAADQNIKNFWQTLLVCCG